MTNQKPCLPGCTDMIGPLRVGVDHTWECPNHSRFANSKCLPECPTIRQSGMPKHAPACPKAPKPPEAPKVVEYDPNCGACKMAALTGKRPRHIHFADPESVKCVVKDFDTEADAEAWIKEQEVKPAPAPEPKCEVCGLTPDNKRHCCPPVTEPKQGSEEPIDFDYLYPNEQRRAYLALRAQLAQAREEISALKAQIPARMLRFPQRRLAGQILSLEQQLAQAREERDKFEAESEQKGADLMAAEGVIAEIIGAHERSASSELGQLIEDARAARAKESQ